MGGKLMHTAYTLFTLFKNGNTTQIQTLNIDPERGGGVIRPFKLRAIRREYVKLGRNGCVFNV